MRLLLLVGLLLFSPPLTHTAYEPIPTGCGAVEPLPVSFVGMIEVAGPARWQVAGHPSNGPSAGCRSR